VREVFVKICGLRSADAVEAAVEAGADAIGFVFAESPRRIAPAQAAVLAASMPPQVLSVGVFRHPTQAECDAVFAEFTPDYIQTDAEDFATLVLPRIVRHLPVFRDGDVVPVKGERILFEGKASGTGETADWDQAREMAAHNELILAGGLDAENVADAIRAVRPWGVDVSSGVERSRGIKDPAKIRAFIARVRALEN
jgi:phosphoribosylanthranilate isomerase